MPTNMCKGCGLSHHSVFNNFCPQCNDKIREAAESAYAQLHRVGIPASLEETIRMVRAIALEHGVH